MWSRSRRVENSMIKIIFFILAQSAMAIDWIALHKTDYNGQICDQLDELSPIQKRICIRYPKLMDAILTASKQTKRSCTVSFCYFSLELFIKKKI